MSFQRQQLHYLQEDVFSLKPKDSQALECDANRVHLFISGFGQGTPADPISAAPVIHRNKFEPRLA